MEHWFPPGHFFPRKMQDDPAWQNLSKGGHKVYRNFCKKSWLTKKSPNKRYTRQTYKQIAKETGLSRIQVQRIVTYLMAEGLIHRHYPGHSGSTTPGGRPTPPTYELPASLGMIEWWRKTKKPRKQRPKKRKEANHVRKDHANSPDLPLVLSSNGFHRRC